MLNTEREPFETQLAVLFGGFPQFLTPPRVEAYWRGLAKMPLATFIRCVDQALGEAGPDKLPSVNYLWQLSRSLRARPVSAHAPEAPAFDEFHTFGQHVMFAWLKLNGPLDEGRLHSSITAKNRVIDDYRACGESDAAEWLDILMDELDKSIRP